MTQDPKTNGVLHSILTKPALQRTDIVRLFSSLEIDSNGLNDLEAYLMVLIKRGADKKEILEIVNYLLNYANQLSVSQNFIDVCGTGGDQSNSFNISTTTAFVLAGAGIPVLKHGNRSISSKCGSSDLLESLGVNLEAALRKAKSTLRSTHFSYLHAPFCHPFFAMVAPLRKKIGVPTIFNYLGPLLHPARPKYQLVGISNEQAFKVYPELLKQTGRHQAIVIHGACGMDEATPFGKTQLLLLKGSKIKSITVTASNFGFKAKGPRDLEVSDRKENIAVFKKILGGKEKGPKLEAVLLNAGLGFCVYDKANTLREGIQLARNVIESGKAKTAYEGYVEAVKK